MFFSVPGWDVSEKYRRSWACFAHRKLQFSRHFSTEISQEIKESNKINQSESHLRSCETRAKFRVGQTDMHLLWMGSVCLCKVYETNQLHVVKELKPDSPCATTQWSITQPPRFILMFYFYCLPDNDYGLGTQCLCVSHGVVIYISNFFSNSLVIFCSF